MAVFRVCRAILRGCLGRRKHFQPLISSPEVKRVCRIERSTGKGNAMGWRTARRGSGMMPFTGEGEVPSQGVSPDDDAFSAQLPQHIAVVLRVAAALVGTADAEDAAQE